VLPLPELANHIYRAVHEGKWLSVEYENAKGSRTKYWIGIRDIHLPDMNMTVTGLHLATLETAELTVSIERIVSSVVVEGTYFPLNEALIDDIYRWPEKYASLFGKAPNLKILNYLVECFRLNCNNELRDSSLSLIDRVDADVFTEGEHPLSGEQFRSLMKARQNEAKSKGGRQQREFAINILGIHHGEKLLPMAYRTLRFDPERRCLRLGGALKVNKEWTVGGGRILSVSNYLGPRDLGLLDRFEKNLDRIKQALDARNREPAVDDIPWVFSVDRYVSPDLDYEFAAITDMYAAGTPTWPVRAFFGELTSRPLIRREYSPAFLYYDLNIDQLTAVHNAMKRPVSYVQGPPGDGKTHTIDNTIMTALFNGRTVLFASNNNRPIDHVYGDLSGLVSKGRQIPFPVARMGNYTEIGKTLDRIGALCEFAQEAERHGEAPTKKALDAMRKSRTGQMKEFTALLRRHAERLNLLSRIEAHTEVAEKDRKTRELLVNQLKREKERIEAKLAAIPPVTAEEAFALLPQGDREDFLEFLYLLSLQYILKLGEPVYEPLREIVNRKAETDKARNDRIRDFLDYLAAGGNLARFLDVFPVICTTNVSANHIGAPGVHFDLVIMDEASQCEIASSLMPILRGENLMLVGDPGQLRPVINLRPEDHALLKANYGVDETYDYAQKSIYTCMLAADSLSDEVLLREHYRCQAKIIGFSNEKYYGGKLNVKTKPKEGVEPLHFINVSNEAAAERNTSPAEADAIVKYCRENQGQVIGVITPFVAQKELIEEKVKAAGLKGVEVGTVHAYQGEEKETIVFSPAITQNTARGTYNNFLKNNQELLNVATTRARDRFVLVGSMENARRLHEPGQPDDMYDLFRYVRSNGTTSVSKTANSSRALGVKPFSSKTEEVFLKTLNHAVGVLSESTNRLHVQKEVPVKAILQEEPYINDLFYSGVFDFVVFEGKYARLAVELDGREHASERVVRDRDRKKQEICSAHNFELIRVPNSYARRYGLIKSLLVGYFGSEDRLYGEKLI